MQSHLVSVDYFVLPHDVSLSRYLDNQKNMLYVELNQCIDMLIYECIG